MTSIRMLERRFRRIDQLLETIASCEAELDATLGADSEGESAAAVTLAPSAPPPLRPAAPIDSDAALAEEVAAKIKTARRRKGWRQKDLSDATGIARPNIARLESGRRMPKLSTLHKIGHALGISVEALLRPGGM